MIQRPWVVAAARLVNAAFFLVTATYCLLTYNAFAYQQFIRPHLILALTWLVAWHALLYWLVLLLTVVTLLPLAQRPRERRAMWLYVGASAAAGAWLLYANVLPEVENSFRSLVLAVAALLPPIALAVVDHLITAGRQGARRTVDWTRTWKTTMLSAALVWATYAAAAPLRLRQAGDIALGRRELALAVPSSLVFHAAAFAALFVALMAAVAIAGAVTASLTGTRAAAAPLASSGGNQPLESRASATGGPHEYWVCIGAIAAGVACVLVRLVFNAIAFRGGAAWVVALTAGVMIALLWSSVARYRALQLHHTDRSALDIVLLPLASYRRAVAFAAVCVLPAAAFAITARAARFDWNFMVQQVAAIGIWVLAFASVHAAAGRSGGGRWSAHAAALVALYAAMSFAMPRLPAWIGDSRFHPDFVLDGYAATDPSFRVLHGAMTRDPAEDAEFYAFLRANTTIPPEVRLLPPDVRFVERIARPARRPNIFFFLIDSLRPDYTSIYNRAVTFTPNMEAFARETGSFPFQRAFTRYGGTGLSVPAIWSGSMVAHREYVTPFAPTNALEKLLDANGYRQFITRDHITELFTSSPLRAPLDRDVPEMQHTFCGTVGELKQVLANPEAARPPLFVHTRPLDLHISIVHNAPMPEGESYPGFDDRYAARVRRIDACFGDFVRFLKHQGLYDDSVVILTSDHGDSLGDGLRWGHAYTLFSEVIRIPLVVHLPRTFEDLAADLDRAAFTTDLTPTLYALLGNEPRRQGPLYGAPLFETRGADLSWRRREPELIVSSYGAVYAMLRENGRKLYIADAINEREYAYELGEIGRSTRVGVTDAERSATRQLIREQVEAVATAYRLTLDR